MKNESCHEDAPTTTRAGAPRHSSAGHQHPDHGAQKKRLNRARGQLDGIERMIDERRYCMDIITQIRAAKSALGALEVQIIETHLRGCVRSAFSSKHAFDIEEKIKEIMKVIS